MIEQASSRLNSREKQDQLSAQWLAQMPADVQNWGSSLEAQSHYTSDQLSDWLPLHTGCPDRKTVDSISEGCFSPMEWIFAQADCCIYARFSVQFSRNRW
ncbi:hypothetical protein EMIT053CA3_30287 [Pseudomonas donghuensis]